MNNNIRKRLKLKRRILNEMVKKNTPKEKLKDEIFKNIGYRYNNYQDFEKSFNKVYRKIRNGR